MGRTSLSIAVAVALCTLSAIRLCSDAGAAEKSGIDSGAAQSASPLADASAVRALADGRALLDAAKYAEAESLGRRLLADAEIASGADSPAAADALDLIAESLLRARRVKDPEARSLAERAVAIRENAAPVDSAALGRSLVILATVVRVSGDYAAARPLYERALAIQEKALGPDAPDLSRTLNAYGVLLHRTDEYAEARAAFERAVAITERADGRDHPSLAPVLYNLGNVVRDLEDLESAKQYQERAIAIWERTLGPDHPETAKGLNGLGHVLRHSGDYEGARALYERALAIYLESEGPEGPNVSYCSNNMGQILDMMGEYDAARPHIERAIRASEASLGPEHPEVFPEVVSLGNLESVLGNDVEAKALFERALAGWEKSLGPDHTRVAIALTNLGETEHRLGNHASALAHLERGLAIREKALGPDHKSVALSLDALGALRNAMGDREGAIRDGERAVAIWERALGPDHVDVAVSLIRLAETLADAGELDRAEQSLRRAAAIEERGNGPEHPDLAGSLQKLGSVLFAMDRREEAFATALRAEEIAAEHLGATARGLLERDALRLEAVRASGLDIAFSVLAAEPSPERTFRSWDRALRSRALVLDEIAARHHAIETTDDPEIAELARRVDSARQRLANLTVRDAGSLSPERRRELIDEARREKETAEREIAARSARFRSELANTTKGLDEISASLPEGSALVGYFHYRSYTPAIPQHGLRESDATHSYLAFALLSGDDAPIAVPLGPAAEIDSAIARWNAALLQSAHETPETRPQREEEERRAGRTVREALWDPIAVRVAKVDRLFIVPDGAVNAMSFGALPDGAHEYLVETGPTIHYLSAERDVLLWDGDGARGTGLLALGGADYDARSLADALEPMRRELAETFGTLAAAAAPLFRGSTPACRGFTSLTFAPLPGTEREIRAIVDIWRESGPRTDARASEKIIRVSGERASEEIVKRAAPGRRVIHLATHGFFLGEACAPGLGRQDEGLAGEGSRGGAHDVGSHARENPLLLCGLALAGANHRASAAPDEDDGILTAEEVAALDLTDVEWAVLSGCETGAGAVVSGEGVFGLRRAFQVAGARTLIMSLWPAEDEATRAWMTALYSARFERDLSSADATREASLAVLRDLRANGRATLPILWGGFVAAGDWR
jgi:tetratricopeptide (TPR) repeat protein